MISVKLLPPHMDGLVLVYGKELLDINLLDVVFVMPWELVITAAANPVTMLVCVLHLHLLHHLHLAQAHRNVLLVEH